jgi:hypothetical protein
MAIKDTKEAHSTRTVTLQWGDPENILLSNPATD